MIVYNLIIKTVVFKMAQERFNLKWDDFQTNISRSLTDIRGEDDFFDVTLVGDDNQQVSAHKVILATSSKHILIYIYFVEVKLIIS